jgi:hypothetical protein
MSILTLFLRSVHLDSGSCSARFCELSSLILRAAQLTYCELLSSLKQAEQLAKVSRSACAGTIFVLRKSDKFFLYKRFSGFQLYLSS